MSYRHQDIIIEVYVKCYECSVYVKEILLLSSTDSFIDQQIRMDNFIYGVNHNPPRFFQLCQDCDRRLHPKWYKPLKHKQYMLPTKDRM